MSKGRSVLLHTPWSDTDKVQLWFTFWYKGDTYAVYRDDDTQENICRGVEWNFWHGASLCGADASDEVCSVAQRIFDLANKYPERYALDGEHYVFEHYRTNTGHIQLKVRVEREALELDSLHRGIPTALRMLIAAAIAVIASYFYCRAGGLGWCAALLTSFSRLAVKTVIYIVTALGSVMLCLYRYRSRGLSDMLLHTIGVISTITTLGVLASHTTLRTLVLIGFAVVALLAALPKLVRAVRTRDRKRRMRELFAAIRALRVPMSIAVAGTACLVVMLGISGPVYSGRVTLEGAGIEENYGKALVNIEETAWKRLSREEKLDTLQSISSWECVNTLGIEPVTVQTGYLEENVLGSYSNTNCRVTVELEHLENDSVYEVLHTLFHEIRHAYQHEAAEMYELAETKLPEKYLALQCFKSVVEYSENFDNYIDGSRDYYAYNSQTVEMDSDNFADWRLYDYYSIIDPDYRGDITSDSNAPENAASTNESTVEASE